MAARVVAPLTVTATVTVTVKKKKKKKRTTFKVAEKRSEAYRRVPPDFNFKPPRSSHHLIQEDHTFDHWRVLIICMFLNITTGKQVYTKKIHMLILLFGISLNTLLALSFFSSQVFWTN